MDLIDSLPFFCIMLSMGAGVISLVLPGRIAYYVNLMVTSLCLVMSSILLVYMYHSPTAITFMMGHFEAPWGNEIRFGPFEALMATLFCLVMLLSCLSQREVVFSRLHTTKLNLFYLMMNLLLASSLALVYTNDLFSAYVFVEMNTLCACGFVAAKNTRKAIAATIKYLIMSLLGSGLFLISIILLYILTGHLLMVNVQESLSLLVAQGGYTMPITIVVGLMAVSIAIKSALFPFHNWVPNAYDRSLLLSNALSSGLVLKSYIILLIKIFYRVIGLELIASLEVPDILFLFGLLSMVVASVDAMRENNIKKMLAYSSIAQIGYVYTAIGLGTSAGFAAATYIIISHSLTKSMLFVSCEGLMSVSGDSKHVDALVGSGLRNPWAGVAFSLGSLSMIGFPLLSGFYAKYMLASAAVGHLTKIWFVLAALCASTVLNAIYFLRIIQTIFSRPATPQGVIPPLSLSYRLAITLFMVANLAFGFAFTPVVQLITTGLALL